MPYIREVFDVHSLEQAANVVLSFDPTDPLKFFNETKYLVDAIEKKSIINHNSTVLDFGCGMGRIARELIARFNCKVIGVDISDSMLAFAREYVDNDAHFSAMKAYTKEASIDVCLSAFVLQHVENPATEIDNIHRVLKPGGYFVLLNERKRMVPADVDHQQYVVWDDDQFDVHAYVEEKFTRQSTMRYANPSLDIIIFRK